LVPTPQNIVCNGSRFSNRGVSSEAQAQASECMARPDKEIARVGLPPAVYVAWILITVIHFGMSVESSLPRD
ncbi:hypothetical protein EV363DRAFT_1157084, partial [Boletus edulis]